jgi:hypothetical protein
MGDALGDLRRTRRQRRLGDTEWFDLAYRVYLAAIFGGGAVIVLSDLVGDEAATPAQVADVLEHGPAALGLAAAVALALGTRSGAEGGPVSVEQAEVRHVLLAPVSRHRALLRPFVQRLRAVAFASAVTGAVGGMLAAQRLPGSPAAWMTSTALAAALVGALFVAVAVVAHAARLPAWSATAIGAGAIGLQVAAVVTGAPGPFDVFGSLALWGARQRAADVLAILVTLGFVGGAVALVGRLRVEPLVRRGELVSQLRFAVTMQDLRTVVVLRRQLRNELPRGVPWPAPHLTAVRPAAAPVWARSLRGLARTPAARIGRALALGAAVGAAAVGVLRGTTPLLVVMGVLLFLLGLEALEPVSQEVDHPERTDGLVHDRGWLLLHLAVPSLGALVAPAIAGAAVVAALEPGAAAAAFAVAVPVAWLGAAGGLVSVVRDAPDPAANESVLVPPEVAGMGNVLRALVPLVLSTAAALPVLALRESPGPGTVVRAVLGLLLALGLLAWWVLRRDEWRRRWRAFVAGARP